MAPAVTATQIIIKRICRENWFAEHAVIPTIEAAFPYGIIKFIVTTQASMKRQIPSLTG